MPNWCSNTLKIGHADKDKMDAVVTALKEGALFEYIFPQPEGVDWYEWRIQNWGTKWDMRDPYFPVSDENGTLSVYEENDLHMASVMFETAWSPPVGVYQQAAEQGFFIEAFYIEEGNGFLGMWTDEGGDNEFSFPDSDDEAEWEEWIKTLPQALVDEFDVRDRMEGHISLAKEYAKMEQEADTAEAVG